MYNAPKPHDKKFLVGNFMSSYMPLARPPERNLDRIALTSGELAGRLHKRTAQRVSRERGYNLFRLVGSVVVITIMALSLYAGITAPDIEDESMQAGTPTEITVPSAERGPSASTAIPGLFQ